MDRRCPFRRSGSHAELEELISGPGLVRMYRANCAIAATELLASAGGDASGEGAGAVAEAAHRGNIEALAAVNIYYRALGHFAQTLALTYLPCAAVVIGGESTKHNLELLRHSGLAETFAEHPRFAGLLGGVPVFTVDGEVNLEGGLWLAARASR